MAAPIRLLVTLALVAPMARAAEQVTLRNGFSFTCARREPAGDKVRLYFAAADSQQANYLDVSGDAIVSVVAVADPVASPAASIPAVTPAPAQAELGELLEHAGHGHNIDAALLASVVKAESGGRVRAVSRTGARGLMQLMPATAAELGVADAFVPQQNVEGGSRYLDTLLTRYHDDIALALAAYNAGPKAVDRYHGVPPFRETRAYVATVIREFNRRKLAAARSLGTVLIPGGGR